MWSKLLELTCFLALYGAALALALGGVALALGGVALALNMGERKGGLVSSLLSVNMGGERLGYCA